MNLLNRNGSWLLALGLAGFLAVASQAYAEQAPAKSGEPAKPTTITTGSGEQYRTTVHRESEGELSPEDYRQVSLLSSRLISHLNRAVQHLADDRTNDAGTELERAKGLVRIVRQLLPTTTVTTTVKDAKGREVYRCVDHVQEDRIPLYEEMIAVEVLEPITDAKQEAAEVRGARLADADLLHTSVLVELPYVERKLNRAAKLLKDKPKEAMAQLALAQARGVTFIVNKQDSPLVSVQTALQLAERMVEQERLEAAKANLQLAKNQLVFYRSLIGKRESEKVRELEKEITKLQAKIGEQDAAKMIREYWGRVAGWWTKEPGAAQKTAGSDKKDR